MCLTYEGSRFYSALLPSHVCTSNLYILYGGICQYVPIRSGDTNDLPPIRRTQKRRFGLVRICSNAKGAGWCAATETAYCTLSNSWQYSVCICQVTERQAAFLSHRCNCLCNDGPNSYRRGAGWLTKTVVIRNTPTSQRRLQFCNIVTPHLKYHVSSATVMCVLRSSTMQATEGMLSETVVQELLLL